MKTVLWIAAGWIAVGVAGEIVRNAKGHGWSALNPVSGPFNLLDAVSQS